MSTPRLLPKSHHSKHARCSWNLTQPRSLELDLAEKGGGREGVIHPSSRVYSTQAVWMTLSHLKISGSAGIHQGVCSLKACFLGHFPSFSRELAVGFSWGRFRFVSSTTREIFHISSSPRRVKQILTTPVTIPYDPQPSAYLSVGRGATR